jgi:hypothetical protein
VVCGFTLTRKNLGKERPRVTIEMGKTKYLEKYSGCSRSAGTECDVAPKGRTAIVRRQ